MMQAGLDELQIRVETPNYLQGDLVIKVLVNGKMFVEGEYCLIVDSFFSAIAESEGRISFLGSCGELACCGVGYTVWSMPSCWKWSGENEIFQFSWSNVSEIAKAVIEEIERVPTTSFQFPLLQSSLPFYRTKLDSAQRLARGETEDE